jgi:3-hydroxy-9,10-secoandrosta-1,3,5(10)-triene-9,17-dione monooxygenase
MMTNGSAANTVTDEIVARAVEMAPALRERTRATELLRRIPDETIAELRAARLFRLLQPARYGGFEADPRQYMEAVFALAAADTSVGWVYSVLASHAWVAAYFPEQLLDELWGSDPDALIVTVALAKQGGIEKVDGGYRVQGRFGFASGCHHASWVLVFGLPLNAPEDGLIWCLVPRSDWEIDDNWNVMGLCGTGSCDLLIDGEVPAHRSIGLVTGSAVSAAPLYRLPLLSLFAYVPTLPVIGAAQGALDDFVASQRDRVDLVGARPAADPLVQAAVAESLAEIETARATIERNLGHLFGLVSDGGEPSFELLSRMELDRVLAVRHAVQAVDRLFALAGGRALSLDSHLQRAWRDVHAGAAHAANQVGSRLVASGANAFGIQLSPFGKFG